MLHGSGNMYQNTDLWFLKQDALDLMHSHGIFPVPSSQPVSLNLRNPDILLSDLMGSTETIKEMKERYVAFNSCQMSNCT